MTLNDFKSVEGDRRMGIDSLPVLLGVERAARVACLFMAAAAAGRGRAAARTGACRSMPRSWRSCCWRQVRADGAHAAPAPASAPLYNATGTTFYVLGMLTAAFAVQLAVRLP